MADLKDISRKKFYCKENTYEAINCGLLQRIADAAELMARNYKKLIEERDLYYKYFCDERSEVHYRDLSISALRGQITKLKKKLASVKE
jgi:hypothetical protein